MKKITFLVGLVVLATISQHPSIAAELTSIEYSRTEIQEVKEVQAAKATLPPLPKLTNEQVVIQLVDRFATKYSVSRYELLRTLRNENNTFEFCRQSGLLYKEGNRWGFPAGTREQSFGVAQIHLPDHPSVTKAQACDPEFSIEFMAKQFAAGRATMWMGYSR